MTPSPSRRSLTIAACALVAAGLSAGSFARERAPRAPQAAVRAERLLDARVAPQAPTSAGLLAERLGFLGMTETDAIWLATEAGRLTVAELKARIAEAGLAGPQAEKAMQLALALQHGRPIAHVGLEMDEARAAAAWELTTQGADPDAAAWALQRPEGTVELGALPARQDLPSPAIATCKTCPQVDVILAPTTTRQVHASSVEGSGCVMYRFTVQPGRTYRFSTCAADGGSAAFDTLFTTWATQCVPGPTSNDACGTASRIDVTPTAAGYLYLRVSAVSGSGAFRLSYQDLGTLCRSCPSFDRAITSIPPAGGSLADSVPANGCKVYRFSAQASRVYRFTTCPADDDSLDTIIETYTANCSAGPANDDACMNNGSEVVVSSPAAGFIYVRVRGYDGEGGSYTLRYDDATDECHGCPTFHATATSPAYSYRSYPGVLAPGQCFTYRVPLVAGRSYRFSTCSYVGGSSSFFSYIEIRSPDCNSSWYDSGSCGLGADHLFIPAVSGDHYVTVGDNSGTGGTYTLVMGLYAADCPYSDPPTLVPALTSWQLKEGEIEESGQVVRYPLALSAYRIYQMSFCNGSGGYGQAGQQARWLNAACGTLAGSLDQTGAAGSTVEPDCLPTVVTLQNAAARTVPVEVSGTAGVFGLGYREIPCHQFWVAGASEPPLGGQNYSTNPVPAGTFTQFRIAVGTNRSYTFSLCAAEGGSANFDSRLEIFGGSSCTPMTVSRTVCGDDEKVTVNSGAETFLMVRIIDEVGTGGTFTMNARRNP